MATLSVGLAVAILDSLGCNADPCCRGHVDRKALVATRSSVNDFELVDDRAANRVKLTYFGTGQHHLRRGTQYSLVADRLREYGFRSIRLPRRRPKSGGGHGG